MEFTFALGELVLYAALVVFGFVIGRSVYRQKKRRYWPWDPDELPTTRDDTPRPLSELGYDIIVYAAQFMEDNDPSQNAYDELADDITRMIMSHEIKTELSKDQPSS